MYVKKVTSFCQVLKNMHTKENWFVFFCLTVKMKIVYSVWQQCMLDSHNYNKIQTQIRQ